MIQWACSGFPIRIPFSGPFYGNVALILCIHAVFACYTGRLTELIINVNMGSKSFSLGLSNRLSIIFTCLLASIKFTVSHFAVNNCYSIRNFILFKSDLHENITNQVLKIIIFFKINQN